MKEVRLCLKTQSAPGATRLPTLALVALILALLLPASASGMTVLAADLPDLCRDSHTIVRATVASVHNIVLNEQGDLVDQRTLDQLSKDNPPTGLSVFTEIVFRVEEPFKGNQRTAATFRIRLIGGNMGPFTLAIPGMPRFVPNSEVFLFLEKHGTKLIPLGGGQGVFRVERTQSGAATVVHDMNGMAVVRPGPNKSTAGVAIPKRMPLEALATQVRAYLGQSTPADLKSPSPRTLKSR